MSIRRFLSLSVLSVLAIAGGLFVADRRIDIEANADPNPIRTGEALQLGLLLTQKPMLVNRNQIITNALFRVRDQVNQCGGVNQAPVFWVMITPEVETLANAIALEKLGMQTLLWRERVHGAITIFTGSPTSHALYSDALNIAIEAKLPMISPLNSQFLVAQPGHFDQFRRDRPIVTTQADYWVRTIPSDRQQLTAVAQWLQQNEWSQIATVIPDTPRGEHLAGLLGDAIADGGEDTLQLNPVRYVIEADVIEAEAITAAEAIAPAQELEDNPALDLQGDPPGTAEPENEGDTSPGEADPSTSVEADTATDGTVGADGLGETVSPSAASQGTIELLAAFDVTAWVQQPPDVILLSLNPNLSILDATALMDELTALVDPSQVPIMLVNNVDSLWPWLAPWQGSDRPEFSTPYPLANLYGITPHIPAIARRQANQYGLPSPDLRSPPSVFYAWDGAALMMLAAESAGINDRAAIEASLPMVANPPGIEVTDVCQGLELLRQGKTIDYQGISGNVDIDNLGNVNPSAQFDLWQIGVEGDRQLIETFDGQDP